MSTVFSEVLTKLRREAGFPTAYGFYHATGGTPVLKISYRRYLFLEQGRNLPDVGKLLRLSLALRLVPKSSGANELVLAWLRTMAGEETYSNILQPLISESALASGMSPMHKTVKRALAENKYQLTLAQFRAVLADRDVYLCFLGVSNDMGFWSAESLAGVLKLEKKSAAKALKTLLDAGIVKKDRRGLYKCPFASSRIVYPHLNLVETALREKLEAYHKELIASGKLSFMHGCVVRADSAAFREFYPLMALNISTAQTYSLQERTAKSALYWVEGRIVKLRDI
ncbi:MAG: hypothetical protein HY952_01870 [Elusimicrobia bacterium]|nr:hypothetical protein [Elusimicrobiota bacterium]